MSCIGKNIKKIRTVKKISQAAFAEMFDLTRGTVGAYEEERAEPRIDTVIQIAQHFGLSIDVLLTKELTVNELFKFDLFKHEKAAKAAGLEQDKDQQEHQTPLVKKEQYIEYLVNFRNRDFINRLPGISLPDTKHKKSRAFEVQDDSMLQHDKGLKPGDIVSCSPVEAPIGVAVVVGKVYVIVTGKDVLIRRAVAKGKLTFMSDKAVQERLSFSEEEVQELWRVEGYYSTDLRPPLLLEERVASLESRIAALEKRLPSF